MHLFIYALLSLACLEAYPTLSEWENYKIKYNLEFDDDEDDETRRYIFETNYEYIKNENKKDLTYKLGINEFAHLTEDEFAQKYLSAPMVHEDFDEEPTIMEEQNVIEVDWRKKGVVGPVRNQGQCGSCYAFSIAAAIEAMVAIKTGKLYTLSPQQIVDCSLLDFGCSGGLERSTYQYILKSGLQTEESYRYKARESSCKYNRSAVVARVGTYVEIERGERSLTKALHERPLSVRLYASLSSFRFYRSGIYYDPHCTSKITNHLVLAVGYVQNKTSNYFIIKNSWGTNWGVKGYLHLARWKKYNCGVGTLSTYPISD